MAALVLLASPVHAQPGVTQSVEVGELVQGVLTTDDAVDPYRGNWSDFYTVQAYAGQRFEVLLTSEVIDTYLFLQDAVGFPQITPARGTAHAANFHLRLVPVLPCPSAAKRGTAGRTAEGRPAGRRGSSD